MNLKFWRPNSEAEFLPVVTDESLNREEKAIMDWLCGRGSYRNVTDDPFRRSLAGELIAIRKEISNLRARIKELEGEEANEVLPPRERIELNVVGWLDDDSQQ